MIGGTSQGAMNNCLVYNNTVLNMTGTGGPWFGSGFGGNVGIGNVAQNNLLYNQRADTGPGVSRDYNVYYSCSSVPSEAHGQTASGNPFNNAPAGDYTLRANTTAGATLSSPYNADPLGKIRITWTRGAFEYGTLSTNADIDVLPTSLNFGSVLVNTTTNLDLTIRNRGGGTLGGFARVSPPFSFSSDGTVTQVSYTLGSNESKTVTVYFSPGTNSTPTNYSQTVFFTGGNGANVSMIVAVRQASSASIEAESGVISAPFTVTGGYISQTVTDPTGVANGGRAVYNFTVPTNGNYVITALVNAPDLTQNSFYVGMDRFPVDQDAWDILPPTSGFESRMVSYRGYDGTADENHWNPIIYYLTAGAHSLTVVGREPNTLLDRLEITPYGGIAPAKSLATTATAVGQ
jgi:hypothetical protein